MKIKALICPLNKKITDAIKTSVISKKFFIVTVFQFILSKVVYSNVNGKSATFLARFIAVVSCL